MVYQVAMRLDSSSHIEAGQDNPVVAQKQATESETASAPTAWSHTRRPVTQW